MSRLHKSCMQHSAGSTNETELLRFAPDRSGLFRFAALRTRDARLAIASSGRRT